jgi:hypothetical protein
MSRQAHLIEVHKVCGSLSTSPCTRPSKEAKRVFLFHSLTTHVHITNKAVIVLGCERGLEIVSKLEGKIGKIYTLLTCGQ